MTAYNIGKETKTVIAVTQTLSWTSGKTSLFIKAFSHSADTFLRKVFTINQLIFQRIFNSHFLCSFVNDNTRKREKSSAMTHQMPEFYWLFQVFIRKFRNIFGYRIIYRQKSVFLHLHNSQCRKRFCNRRHSENRITRNR